MVFSLSSLIPITDERTKSSQTIGRLVRNLSMLPTLLSSPFRFGAFPGTKGTDFRVWAPRAARVDVMLETRGSFQSVPLTSRGAGLFHVEDAPAKAGDLYRFRLDGK